MAAGSIFSAKLFNILVSNRTYCSCHLSVSALLVFWRRATCARQTVLFSSISAPDHLCCGLAFWCLDESSCQRVHVHVRESGEQWCVRSVSTPKIQPSVQTRLKETNYYVDADLCVHILAESTLSHLRLCCHSSSCFLLWCPLLRALILLPSLVSSDLLWCLCLVVLSLPSLLFPLSSFPPFWCYETTGATVPNVFIPLSVSYSRLLPLCIILSLISSSVSLTQCSSLSYDFTKL